jgi:hypothetical protein
MNTYPTSIPDERPGVAIIARGEDWAMILMALEGRAAMWEQMHRPEMAEDYTGLAARLRGAIEAARASVPEHDYSRDARFSEHPSVQADDL